MTDVITIPMTGNEPVYPSMFYDSKVDVHTGHSISNCQQGGGISKRELFAAMAMQGLCATGNFTDREIQEQVKDANPTATVSDYIAISAVNIADALIASLNKETKTL